RLDRSDCSSTAQAAGEPVTRKENVLQGRDFGLAVRGGVVGIVGTETGAIRFRAVDANNLESRGADSIWAPPPNYPPNTMGLERIQGAWYDPLWSPALTALGDGF